MRKLLVLAASVAAVVTLATGCYALVDLLALEHHGRTYELDPAGTVHLDVDGGGTVRVVGDGGSKVRVETRWREGISAPSIGVRRDGDRIVLRTRCPQFVNLVCQVSATVHVPRGTLVTGGGDSPIQVVDVGGRVDLSSDNGSIRVEGAADSVRASTSNGTITVVDSTGDLSLSTDNGSVRTRSVQATSIVASTSNGSISLDLAAAPGSVVARSDNGSITVLVPDEEGVAYATATSSDNGGVDELIRTDPTSERRIEARSSNGGISLRFR
ncbi:MAG: DUF4097 family beta strand repeat-containing protein [Acidimicrobiales bacterium]